MEDFSLLPYEKRKIHVGHAEVFFESFTHFCEKKRLLYGGILLPSDLNISLTTTNDVSTL